MTDQKCDVHSPSKAMIKIGDLLAKETNKQILLSKEVSK